MLTRILLSLLLILVQSTRIPGPGGAPAAAGGTGPPFIQSCAGNNFGGTTQTCVFGSNVAGTSVLYVNGFVSGLTTLSASGCGGTWHTNTVQNGVDTFLESWTVPSAGACTVTLTAGSTGSMAIGGSEYGPSTGGVDNMVNLADQGTIISGNIPCPSITTGASNERVICTVIDGNAGGSVYTAGSGFTMDAQSSSYGWGFESQTKATAGSVTPGISSSIAADFVTGTICIKQ